MVLIEYPRGGIGPIGFVTGPTRGEVLDKADEELVNVFLPTTSIEDGIKMVISGGIVTPSDELQILQRTLRPAVAGELPVEAPRPDPSRPDVRLVAR